MATRTFPLGEPEKAKVADNKPSTSKREDTTSKKSSPKRDEHAWAEAKRMSGRMSGLDDKAKDTEIQRRYDQIVASNKQTKEWAGDSNLLGDQ